MPSRHNRNARNSHKASPTQPVEQDLWPASSPPKQLPTPLPEIPLSPEPHPPPDLEPLNITLRPPAGGNDGPGNLTHLIDFQDHVEYPAEPDILEAEQNYPDTGMFTSPPFREAHLPSGADLTMSDTQPLPIPPRIHTYVSNDVEDVGEASGHSMTGAAGHTRSPTLPRANTTLENLSRTLRTYVPSSLHIPIPTAAPSPPLVSRPVSFGHFSGQSFDRGLNRTRGHAHATYDYPYDQSRHDAYDTYQSRLVQDREQFTSPRSEVTSYGGYSPSVASGTTYARSGDVRVMQSPREHRDVLSYPRADTSPSQADEIIWSSWDSLDNQRLLLIAYLSGLQIWDCSNMDKVTEVLNMNLTTHEWEMMGFGQKSRIIHAGIIPSPSKRVIHGIGDPLQAERPILGILIQTDEEASDAVFFLYSLRRHHLVKKLSISGLAATFSCTEHFIVISTTTPPTLHILSPTTFNTIFNVPSASLVPFSWSSNSSQSHYKSLTLSNAMSITQFKQPSASQGLGAADLPNSLRPEHNKSQPHPVFACSHRLLAYASPPPKYHVDVTSSPTKSSTSSGVSGNPTNPSSFGAGLRSGLGMTQADLGNAALKVGGSMLSGMKLLGGMAYEAAKSRVAQGLESGNNTRDGRLDGGSPASGLSSRFFSRSAPAGTASDQVLHDDLRERRLSTASSSAPWDRNYDPEINSEHQSTVSPHLAPLNIGGHYVTVLDLSALWTGEGSVITVAEFVASKSQPIADLGFTPDGCGILAVPRDGQVLKVHDVRPKPSVLLRITQEEAKTVTEESHNTERTIASSGLATTRDYDDTTCRLYNLRRGMTNAIIEGLACASDGRWIAMSTRKRTVHVFAVNPRGGQPDSKAHVEGMVKNDNQIPRHGTTDLSPLVRLRVVKHPTMEQRRAPVSFIFIDSSENSLPPKLLPLIISPKVSNVTSSPQLIPQRPQRPKNYQDILMFDPTDGMLSLRRITLEQRPKDQGISVATSVSAISSTSISLPGRGGSGRLSNSPSSNNSSRPPSRLTQAQESQNELIGKDSIIATWNLQRRRDWSEIKRSLSQKDVDSPTSRQRQEENSNDWIAQAELSTFSKSARVLPRSLYFSHQFSFYTLGEDYHALIRRYQFSFSGSKIDVRREVEVSAYSTGVGGESFVEGYSPPRDMRHVSSSFDEPLASAIAGDFDHSNPPTILPMYPNGTPGSKPKSFRNSIPIRTMAGLGDGMSESLGRIRREIHKARSPQILPRSDSSMSGPVPLEFDEEDEDFMIRESLDIPAPPLNEKISRDASASADSSHPPSTPPPDELIESGQGWEIQDKEAVEEAERFDHISVLGFMDEEQAPMMKSTTSDHATPSVKKKGKGKKQRR